MEKYSNSGHPTAHFAKLGQQPNNWAQLMPRLPPINPQFKLSKKFLRPLLSSNTNTQNFGPAPGSNYRGAGGGACRGWTGGHRQHPRRPNRDGSPVKPVSVESLPSST
jgi:hypothetical protein